VQAERLRVRLDRPGLEQVEVLRVLRLGDLLAVRNVSDTFSRSVSFVKA
jgi:hypothetical protein